MAAPSPDLTLTYFDFEGKAQAISLALHIAGIPFVDRRITREDWLLQKGSTPYGHLPVLDVASADGAVTRIPQSLAILLFVGRRSSLLPLDEVQQALITATLCHMMDIGPLMGPLAREVDPARVAAAKGPAVFWFSCVEKQLAASGSGWLVGSQLSVADLACYGVLLFLKHATLLPPLHEAFPAVLALFDRVAALPKVMEWTASHPHHLRPPVL